MKNISGGLPCNAYVNCFNDSGFVGWAATGRPVSGCIELGYLGQSDQCAATYGGIPAEGIYSGQDCECIEPF